MQEVVVWWSPNDHPRGSLYTEHGVTRERLDWNMLFPEPEPVFPELAKKRNKFVEDNSYIRCPAVQTGMKNLFVTRSPLPTKIGIVVNEEGEVNQEIESDNYEQPHWWIARAPSVQNNILLHSYMSYFFFPEEPLGISLTAPFFHQAPHLQYGAIVPGMFDFGSWFRPANLEFNLWEGVRNFEVGEGEPVAYWQFHTNKRIVFKRFFLSKELKSFGVNAANASRWLPGKTLQDRYKMFHASKMREQVLAQIKKNQA
jgi:hypothetical protein